MWDGPFEDLGGSAWHSVVVVVVFALCITRIRNLSVSVSQDVKLCLSRMHSIKPEAN